MVKSNVVNLNTLLRESASDESVDNLKKVEKKLPGSFEAGLEGYRMTAAWARKQMNHYGGEISKCQTLGKQTFTTILSLDTYILDSTSAREKFRSKMEQVNIKAFALIDLINEKSDYQITRKMYAAGIFP
jgi:polysaccharide deacetylase 2 family uncharacterized protein YibQ